MLRVERERLPPFDEPGFEYGGVQVPRRFDDLINPDGQGGGGACLHGGRDIRWQRILHIIRQGELARHLAIALRSDSRLPLERHTLDVQPLVTIAGHGDEARAKPITRGARVARTEEETRTAAGPLDTLPPGAIIVAGRDALAGGGDGLASHHLPFGDREEIDRRCAGGGHEAHKRFRRLDRLPAAEMGQPARVDRGLLRAGRRSAGSQKGGDDEQCLDSRTHGTILPRV
ncbi:MAG: hypothetical protein DMD64_06885 [Gemmatimonadetes bacterium]|nr:MAG: hypothetical protein DMD64_06885 [Gemmatimonadota bacterium]